jgi:aminoglycoside phosphotransferase family enzyme/predicted kinase
VIEPPPALGAAVAETHSGVVFFYGDRAYKAKKPVDLGFLDFRSRDARHRACLREVELNRRFSPDVYLGVADVIGPEGAVIDHLVVMRRMPTSRRLSAVLGDWADADLEREVRRLGERVAAIHADSPSTDVAAASAGREAMLARWERLAGSVASLQPSHADTAEHILRLASRYLDGRAALFEERIAAGCARDGHGDLLADDVFLLDDGPRILDCLDFDDSLRAGDVLADVAFLAMDLERLGRPDLARTFLDAYRTAATAEWPPSLEHHHVAERALVRADVSFIRAGQAGGDHAEVARSLLELCTAHLERARVRAVIVCGPPGTGKSTVAAALADPLDAVVLRTDVVRDEIALGEARYDDAAIDRVYDELLERAAHQLARGRSVVLDATWTTERQRAAGRGIANRLATDLTVLECEAPATVAEDRVRARLAGGQDPSEVTVEVTRERRRAWRPWPGARRLRTDRSLAETVSEALSGIESSPS